MKIKHLSVLLPIASVFILNLAWASGAQAQTAVSDSVKTDRVKVERSADQLRSDLRDAVAHDIDTTDTVLVFNAPGPGKAIVYCRGYDANGHLLGRTATKVPHKGLRYIRASDLANGRDFIGSAFCEARGHVVASSVLLAPGAITHLSVDAADVGGVTRIQFPLVVSY